MAGQAIAERELGLADFDFDLPTGLIAQHPLPDRAASRLLHVSHGRLARDLHFGDLLRTARSRRPPGLQRHARDQGATVRPQDERRQGRGAGRTRAGTTLRWRRCAPATSRSLRQPVCLRHAGADALVDGRRRRLLRSAVRPRYAAARSLEGHGQRAVAAVHRARRRCGRRGALSDRLRARTPGAVAAPTAGLHFDTRLLDALHSARRAAGSPSSRCMSAPARSSRCAGERLGRAPHARRALRDSGRRPRRPSTRRVPRGGRVVAVGTTSLRALESAARDRRHACARAAPKPRFSSRRATASASSTGCSPISTCRSRRC